MTIRRTLLPGVILLGEVCATGNRSQAQSTSGTDRQLRADGSELIEQALDHDQRSLRTTLADMSESDVREAPSNVIIITARQIQASGARDLYEALRLVPGLSFGRDVDDVVGIGIHGNWAEEGKCLFMLNGLQLNENDFGTYSIGQRIPLDNVERIEVIMGPGSVIHGGYAALGVINIVTRTARTAIGAQASASASYAGDRISGTRYTVSGSNAIGADQEVSYLAHLYRGYRSGASTLLPDSTPISFADSTAGQSAAFQFGYRWRGLKGHIYYMDEGFEVSDGGYQTRMRDMILALEQRKELGKRVQLGWKLIHDDQIPWYYVNTDEAERIASNTSNVRTSLQGNINIKLKPWLSIRIGGQAYRQRSTFFRRRGVEFAINGSRAITMTDAAGFAELEAKGKLGTLSTGYRFESNSLTGRYQAPRVSYAKVMGRFHVKVQASRAFKVPTIMNLNYGPVDGAITTEHVTTLETELGVRIGAHSQFTGNLYRTVIRNPIVYVYDAVSLDNYINRNCSGTEGFDARYQLERDRFNIHLGYGIYRTIAESDLPETELPDHCSRGYQALPTQRATATMAGDLGRHFTVRGQYQWSSMRYSYQFVDQSGTMALVAWAPEHVVNMGITWRPDDAGKWSIDVGMYNALDIQRHIVNPSGNGSIPLTLTGREYALKLTYRFAQS